MTKIIIHSLLTSAVLTSAVLTSAVAIADENDYYMLSTVNFPKELKLEVSGMAALPEDRMAIAIRKGEIWIAEKISTNKPIYRQFASGLHEPLGLAYHKGDLYTCLLYTSPSPRD